MVAGVACQRLVDPMHPEASINFILFSGATPLEQLQLIMQVCGMPPDEMIDEMYYDAECSSAFVADTRDSTDTKWRLQSKLQSKYLDKLLVNPSWDEDEANDFRSFVRFLLVMDPNKRPKPRQALMHKFIAGSDPSIYQPAKRRRRLP